MNTYLKLVQENLNHHKIRSAQILQEEVQRGMISKKDFLELTSTNEKEFETLIKKEVKKLMGIYETRYSKQYGKLTSSAISFEFNPPSLIYIQVIVYRKGPFSYHVMQSNIDFNLPTKKFESSDFYIFYESNGKYSEKIAEGDEKEEFTVKGKYGELLNIVNPIKNLHSSKTIRYKI